MEVDLLEYSNHLQRSGWLSTMSRIWQMHLRHSSAAPRASITQSMVTAPALSQYSTAVLILSAHTRHSSSVVALTKVAMKRARAARKRTAFILMLLVLTS